MVSEINAASAGRSVSTRHCRLEADRVRISADAWVRLGPAPQGEVLTARVALPDVTERLVCAIDREAIRHLLISLEPGDDSVADKESRGVTASTRELAVSGATPGRYIDVVCHDPAGYEAF